MSSNRSLVNRLRVAALEKGIYNNCMITAVDVADRRGKNGILNKMVFIKFAHMDSGKRKAETEISWWKPDATSEYFRSNLLEFCVQLHGILCTFMTEDEAFDAFEDVFNTNGITDHNDIGSKQLKKSELDLLYTGIKDAFLKAVTPFINSNDNLFRLKLTTNFKGEDVDIPKYGVFTEPMSITESLLKFSDAELKTHSKSGNVVKKDNTDINVTI